MNTIKKALATVLSAAMLFTMATGAFAAMPSDAAGSKYAEAIETLGALKIMVGDAGTGLFRPEDAIKRSEFAKIAVTALGLEDVAESANYQTKYPDVVANHWANGYINVATNQGLVVGDDVGTFRPDDVITYQEAMTILVRVIGHEPSAKVKGGYPTGYLVVGAENLISKSATSVANAPATRGLVAQMTFNSLTAKLMEQTGYGSTLNYEVVNKTLLSNKLQVEKLTGQVTATSQTKLNGSGSLKVGEVEIGGVVYKLGNADAANLLGYNVVFYVHENDIGENELLLVRAEDGKNDAMSITAKNFESIADATGKKVVSYWKNKETDTRTIQIDVADNARLIYNGKFEAMDNALVNLKDKAGFVNLLDSDRDGKYDLIFVTEYKNLVVEEVLPTTGKIIAKYGAPTLTLDPEDKDLQYAIWRGTQKIDVKDLNEFDVLSIAASKDAMIYNIIVTTEKVQGKVVELDSGKVRVGNTLYEVAANYTLPIQLEDEGTFYLDAEGKIAAVDATSLISSNYAYVMNAAMGSYADERLELRLYTKDGANIIIKAEDKIRLNGVSNKTGAEVLAALKGGTGSVIAQMITFEKNSAGNITAINFANDNTATGEVDKYNFTKNYVLNGAVYKTATGKVGNVNVDENTIIFDLPAGSTDSEDYGIRNKSMFENDTAYDVVVFDMSEDFTAKMMVVTSASYEANAESAIAIVDTVTSTKNAQQMTVDKLYAMQDGKSINLLASGLGVLVKDANVTLQKGDIIQYKVNSKGEISTFRLLLDISESGTQMNNTPAEDLEILYGQVTQKFSTSMNMTVNGGATRNISLTGAKVYKVDATKTVNAIQVATAGDIQKYDSADASYVFVKIYKDVVTEVVIIKL